MAGFTASRVFAEREIAQGLAVLAAAGEQTPAALPDFARQRAEDQPARLALVSALLNARFASAAPPGSREREALLRQADATLSRALTVRPEWGAAWVVRTYINYLERGLHHPATQAAFVRSYRTGPYLRDSADWRLRFARASWADLDTMTRDQVIDEAVWLSGRGRVMYWNVYIRLGGTPAYPAYIKRRKETFARFGYTS